MSHVLYDADRRERGVGTTEDVGDFVSRACGEEVEIVGGECVFGGYVGELAI